MTFMSDEWRAGGLTGEDGEVILQLLPKDYLFNMEYAGNTMVKAMGVTAPESMVEFEWDGESLKNSAPLEQEQINRFSIYPNPSHADFSVSFTLEEDCTLIIDILNMEGKVVRQLYN